MWDKELPTKPGRYWWKSIDGKEYGIALLQYDQNHYKIEFPGKPKVRARTTVVFNGTHFGEVSGEGWATVIGSRAEVFWWDKVVTAPRGFLKRLPGPPKLPTQKEVQQQILKKRARRRDQQVREELIKDRRDGILHAAISGKQDLWKCPSCEDFFSEGELGSQRECSHDCGEFFVGPGEDKNCITCNRPFTRHVEDNVCPECEWVCDLLVKKGNMVDAQK